MFLNLYTQNFQKERKASVNEQLTRAMSALSCYHGKITFHKSTPCSSDCQKPHNLVKCFRLWLMINEAWVKKSFYISMCKFPGVCVYITVFHPLTFKGVWSTMNPGRQLFPLFPIPQVGCFLDHDFNTCKSIK